MSTPQSSPPLRSPDILRGPRPSITTGGPLAGITVLTIEHAVAAPMATRQLADLGARVIKIERRDRGDFARDYDRAIGGELSSVFLWVARGKESVTVDLTRAEGRDVIHRLLQISDVFVQNLSPGACDRLGLGVDDLRSRYPRLVYASNSGYGEPGPYSGRRAYDAIVQSESGTVAGTGTPDLMVKPGFSAADIASGMYMFSGILAGLYQRERTGQGTTIDVTMLEAITDWMGNHLYYAQHTGAPADRVDIGHPSLVPYGAYPTSDDGWIVIAIQNEREWARFAEHVLGRPDLATDPETSTNVERAKRRTTVDELIARHTQSFTREQLQEQLDLHEIANGRVNGLLEAAAHPQLLARDRWVRTETPVGPVDTLRPVINERGVKPVVGSVPKLGEHSRDILLELGYTNAQVDELIEREVI